MSSITNLIIYSTTITLSLSIASKDKIDNKFIDGYWEYSCDLDSDYSGYISIKNHQATIEIASNQIYINSILSPIKEKSDYEVYYDSADIGLGGVSILFESIDDTIPIAKITMNDKIMKFYWFGVTNKEGDMIDILFTSLPVKEGTSLSLNKCEQ